MSDKLLPCPFCGGPARVLGDDGKFYAICVGEDCYAAIGERYDRDAMPDHFYLNQEDAASAWNTRSNPSHAQLAAARRALEPFIRAARLIEKRPQDYGDKRIAAFGSLADAHDLYPKHFLALLPTLAQEPAGQSEAASQLRETTVDVLASLVAALSILRRAQEQKRKPSLAVASDKMFEQMLKDYDASVERARTSLAAGSASPGVTAEPTLQAIAMIVDPSAWKNEDGYLVEQEHSDEALSKAESIRALFAAHPTVKVSGDAAEMRERAIRAVTELDCMYVNDERIPYGGIPADPESAVWREAIKQCEAALRALPLTPEGRS